MAKLLHLKTKVRAGIVMTHLEIGTCWVIVFKVSRMTSAWSKSHISRETVWHVLKNTEVAEKQYFSIYFCST